MTNQNGAETPEQAPNVHIMVDLETMGTHHRAPILSVGACVFSPAGGEIEDSFYTGVELQSNMAAGRMPDASTIMWWMSPERAAAREALLEPNKVDLFDAMIGLSTWATTGRGGGHVIVWGNGATFDNVILESAYNDVGLPKFWSYRHDRCYRTLRALAPHIEVPSVGTSHHALDDAIFQAKHLQAVVKELGLTL